MSAANRIGSAPATATLEQFQDDFAQALLDPEGDSALPDDIAALARQPGFAVYRNTTVKGCVDALQANYPAVARLVGDEWFRAAARVFVRGNLPTGATLLNYGAGFERFLSSFEPAAELPYLAGVARLDRLWTEAHVARNDVALDAEGLAAGWEPAADIVLPPHAAARWSWFDDQPIYTIWSRNRAAGPYDKSEMDWHSEGALLVRPQGDVRWIGIGATECAFLDACADRRPLAEALDAARGFDAGVEACALVTRLAEAGALARPEPLLITPADR